LCQTNAILRGQPLSNQTYGVTNRQSYYFGFGPPLGGVEVPSAYFCNWTFTLDPASLYAMTIKKYKSNATEILSMSISSAKLTDNLSNKFLAQLLSQTDSTMFRVLYPTLISIYAVNINRQFNRTFTIGLAAEYSTVFTTSAFSVITLILFVLMLVFICVCIGAIIRICYKRRQMSQQENVVQQNGPGNRRVAPRT